MSVAIITGSGGLIGSESVRFFSSHFDVIIGIDNDMRAYYFGEKASTNWNVNDLSQKVENYVHHSTDIRDYSNLEKIFLE